MFDYSPIATRKLQADTDELANAADRENTGFSEYKKPLEENKDGVRKAEEAGEEEDERLLVSKNMIDSGVSGKNTLIITPPPSIAVSVYRTFFNQPCIKISLKFRAEYKKAKRCPAEYHVP